MRCFVAAWRCARTFNRYGRRLSMHMSVLRNLTGLFERPIIAAHYRSVKGVSIVQVVDLNNVETLPRGEGLEVAFPVSSATGTAATAIVWIELDAGGSVPEHRDSAEELLFVVRGE